ncbi:hypothetical protein Scep_017076 [Stephania cephalantha]|uniref:Uncharacterized protein n=1 Tax=Stephania cephalantha TaxID=152367 RepID=A0AAP0IQ81_9MAGN
MPINETALYLSFIERDDKCHIYELRWTPSRSGRRHAGARCSQPMHANNEPIEL